MSFDLIPLFINNKLSIVSLDISSRIRGAERSHVRERRRSHRQIQQRRPGLRQEVAHPARRKEAQHVHLRDMDLSGQHHGHSRANLDPDRRSQQDNVRQARGA